MSAMFATNASVPAEKSLWASSQPYRISRPILSQYDKINIRLPGRLQANSTLNVLDITGRIVLHQVLGLGIKSLLIPVGSWDAGVYCLRLDSGDKVRTTRFMER